VSERPPSTEQALGPRTAKFVEEYAADGLWWVFDEIRTSRQPTIPFERVEFQTYEKTWLHEDVARGLVDLEHEEMAYRMDVYFRAVQGEFGFISLMVGDDESVEIIDHDAKLAAFDGCAYDDGADMGRLMGAVESLLDELAELKEKDIFVPIRKRRFPEEY
jgi:hypothetical protein